MKRVISLALAALMLSTTALAAFSKDGSVAADGKISISGVRSIDTLRDVVIASPSVVVEALTRLEVFDVYNLENFEKLGSDLPYVQHVDPETGEDLTEYTWHSPYYIDDIGEYIIEYAELGDEPKRVRLVIVSANDFPDTAAHWASGEITYSSDMGWFYGDENGLFSPESPITRAQAVTVLWRICGRPAPRIWTEDPNYRPFADVAPGEYYTEAITWAMSVDIASGTGKGFEPNRAVTRAELAVLLLRTLRYMNPTESHDSTDGFYTSAFSSASFSDVASVEEWARPAIGWAYLNDILRGDEKGVLRPNAPVTRAEAAAMLFRAMH